MPSPAELLPLAAALPEGEASKYVAGAYIVFVLLLLVYLAIMATKVQRIERELRELGDFAEEAAGRPGMPGREAEDMPATDSAKPQTGSDRDLAPSESVGGPAAVARGDRDV